MKNEIHYAARNAATVGKLDEVIFDANVLEAFATTAKQSQIVGYFDVHIELLKGVLPEELLEIGDTWRTGTYKLTCIDWCKYRTSIVQYFTSNLSQNLFPVPDALSHLELAFTGAAGYCQRGKHRLIAAKSWIAYNQPNDPYLRMAECYITPVRASLKKLLIACIKHGHTVSYFLSSNNDAAKYPFLEQHLASVVLKVSGADSSSQIFIIRKGEEEIIPIPAANSRGLKWLQLKCISWKFGKLPFKPLPADIMKLLVLKPNISNTSNIVVTY